MTDPRLNQTNVSIPAADLLQKAMEVRARYDEFAACGDSDSMGAQAAIDELLKLLGLADD